MRIKEEGMLKKCFIILTMYLIHTVKGIDVITLQNNMLEEVMYNEYVCSLFMKHIIINR